VAGVFAIPEATPVRLSLAPRLESWNRHDDPAQVALREFVAHTRELIEPTLAATEGPLAFRLDVGLADALDPLWQRDLDNYLFPIARGLPDRVVCFWATKQRGEGSYASVEPAMLASPAAGWREIIVSRSSPAEAEWKRAVYRAVEGESELPFGPVAVQLAFSVGPSRNWTLLWKPTIDALDPLLGRTYPHREWNPQDGRIVRLGLHHFIDPDLGHDARVTVYARTADAAWPEVHWLTSMDPTRREAYRDQYQGKLLVGAERALLGYEPPSRSRPKPHLPPVMSDVRVFIDDDAGYVAWLTEHDRGFVINIQRSLNPSDARLHRANCRTVTGQPTRGKVWTGPYIKVCADQLSQLDRWAGQLTGSAISRCGICLPPRLAAGSTR
jgi:hypothetical protein